MVPKIISLYRKLIAANVTIILSCVYGFGNQSAIAQDKRLVLRQTHHLYGVVDVEIGANAVKVTNHTTDYGFLCKAPDWDAIIYSGKRKLISRRKFSEWSKSGIRTALSVMDNQALYKWPKTIVAKRKFKGLDSIMFAFPPRYENGLTADLKYGKFGEYVVATGVPVDKRIVQYLQALYDLPPEAGIPLKFDKYGQGNSFGLGLKYNETSSVIDILDTISVKWDGQTVTVDPKLQTYRIVPESEIVVKNSDISDVFSTLMDDDKAKPKGKSGNR